MLPGVMTFQSAYLFQVSVRNIEARDRQGNNGFRRNSVLAACVFFSIQAPFNTSKLFIYFAEICILYYYLKWDKLYCCTSYFPFEMIYFNYYAEQCTAQNSLVTTAT